MTTQGANAKNSGFCAGVLALYTTHTDVTHRETSPNDGRLR